MNVMQSEEAEDFLHSEEVVSWLLLDTMDTTRCRAGSFASSTGIAACTADYLSGTIDNTFFDQEVPTVPVKLEQPQNIAAEVEKSTSPASKKRNKSTDAAKEARKKQRSRVIELEEKVKVLSQENAELQAHADTVHMRTTELQKHRSGMEKMMLEKLAKMASNSSQNADGTPVGFHSKTNLSQTEEKELEEITEQYSSFYTDYGEYRRKEVMFHLQQLEKLLIPTQTTKMCLWTMQQDKSFYVEKSSPMFNILSQELELNSAQLTLIQQRKEKIQVLVDQLNESLGLIESLKVNIQQKHAEYDGQCGAIRQLATAKQTVLFLLWVNSNAEKLSRVVPEFNLREMAPAQPDNTAALGMPISNTSTVSSFRFAANASQNSTYSA